MSTDKQSADSRADQIARCRDFASARSWPVVLIVMTAALAVGCGATRLDYTPRAGVAKEQAIAVVQRALEEQPRQYAPIAVETTAERIAITHNVYRRSMIFATTLSPQVTTIYWDNLGDSVLYTKRGRYSVDIVDRDSHLHLRVYLNTEGKAHGLVDALESLRLGPK